MSLILDFEVEPSGDCKSFEFVDTTGVYDASSNPGGFGSPNPPLSDVTVATVTITAYQSSTAYTVDVLRTSPPFPNTDDTPFTISNADLGLGTTSNIPSGIYQIEYSVTASSVYTVTKNIYLSCVHLCCLDELVSRYAAACNCNDKTKEDLLKLVLRLEANILAIGKALSDDCPKVAEAQNLIEWNNDICAGSGCGCNG